MESLFTGRKRELQDLKSLLAKKSASLVVIRGRRRIGKSRLVDEFAKNMNYFTFTGLPPEKGTTAQSQREEFARQLRVALRLPGLKADDWGDLFTMLSSAISNDPVIVMLDEITWMGSKDDSFLGKLKVVWDLYFSKMPNLILILCGSVSSWIEKNILSSTGFLGRVSLKIHLRELSLLECSQLLEKIGFRGSVQEKFMVLSLTGGIPWYIEQINPKFMALENIHRLCFTPNGLFVDEFKSIFHDLFGKRSKNYRKIVEFLANGPADNTTIANNIHYASSGKLSEYLEELVLAGYVGREHTWSLKTGKESRNSRYRIRDNFLRFYLKYMLPNLSKIERDSFKNTSLLSIPSWESIMGLQFENLVINNRDLLLQELGIRPEEVVYDNPFFQKKVLKSQGCQIDYLIQTRFGNLFVCEIKFSRNPIATGVIEEMQTRLADLQAPRGYAKIPVLIHVNGVTPEIEESGFFSRIIDFGNFLHIKTI
ncbi:MAG: ATP-binding protein [Chlamydiota bacterium]